VYSQEHKKRKHIGYSFYGKCKKLFNFAKPTIFQELVNRFESMIPKPFESLTKALSVQIKQLLYIGRRVRESFFFFFFLRGIHL
jgi:hypothetical protein